MDIVFDTGAPQTTGPENVVKAYYSKVPGAKDTSQAKDGSGWTVPCGSNLPDLELRFNSGGNNAVALIPGSKFLMGNTQKTGDCQSWFAKEGSANRGAVGDPFFIQHTVIYNQQDATISWGNQK